MHLEICDYPTIFDSLFFLNELIEGGLMTANRPLALRDNSISDGSFPPDSPTAECSDVEGIILDAGDNWSLRNP